MYSPAERALEQARGAREEADLVDHRRDLLRPRSAPAACRCSALSSSTSSSACSSMTSAMASSAFCRSRRGRVAPASRTPSAAAGTRGRRPGAETPARCANTSPVVGSTRSRGAAVRGCRPARRRRRCAARACRSRRSPRVLAAVPMAAPRCGRGGAVLPQTVSDRQRKTAARRSDGISNNWTSGPRIRLPRRPRPGQDCRSCPDGSDRQRVHRPRRRLQGHHRAAPAGRPTAVRRDRQGRRALRGGGPPAGPAPARRRRHADRRRHRPAHRRLPARRHDRHPRRGRHARSSPTSSQAWPRSTTSSSPPASFDLLVEVVCEDDDHLLDIINKRIRADPRSRAHRDLRLPEAAQADLHLGYPMTTHRAPSALLAREARRRPPRPARRSPTRARPPVDALHPSLDVRDGRPRPGHRPRRRRLHLRRPGQALPRRARRAVHGPGRARPHRARRRRRQAGGRAGVLPAVVATRTRRRSSWPSAWPTTRPATSTGSSSPPAAARRSRPRGSWPSSSSSSPASP